MIGRMSTDQIHQSGLDVILDAQARLARTQEELASGKRILNPSDDPVASAQIQSVKSELTRIGTLQKNISHATSASGNGGRLGGERREPIDACSRACGARGE